jgi:hypothetical protein
MHEQQDPLRPAREHRITSSPDRIPPSARTVRRSPAASAIGGSARGRWAHRPVAGHHTKRDRERGRCRHCSRRRRLAKGRHGPAYEAFRRSRLGNIAFDCPPTTSVRLDLGDAPLGAPVVFVKIDRHTRRAALRRRGREADARRGACRTVLPIISMSLPIVPAFRRRIRDPCGLIV